MNPAPRFILFLAVMFSFPLPADLAAAPAGAPRPNVLLIIADDLGFSDLGAYGGEMRTPNLDRLAAEGMRFTQFYNCAVCQPTRGVLYTGLYPRAGGDERVGSTSGEIMREAGYVTGLFGKWGLWGRWSRQRPSERGFDETFAYLNTPRGNFRPVPALAASPVADFIDHNAPHDPLHALPEDIARHRGKYRDGYLPLRERRFQRQLAMGLFEAKTTKLSAPGSKTGDFKFDFGADRTETNDLAARLPERVTAMAATWERWAQRTNPKGFDPRPARR